MAHALSSSIAPALKRLLARRRDQLAEHLDHDLGELAHFIVAAPGDTLAAIEMAAGFSFTPDSPWEWVIDHNGIFEAPIIVSDDGFGIILIVPDVKGMDAKLIRLLRIDANT
jgi:hypothetical protein